MSSFSNLANLVVLVGEVKSTAFIDELSRSFGTSKAEAQTFYRLVHFLSPLGEGGRRPAQEELGKGVKVLADLVTLQRRFESELAHFAHFARLRQAEEGIDQILRGVAESAVSVEADDTDDAHGRADADVGLPNPFDPHGSRLLPAGAFARRMDWTRQALHKAASTNRVFYLERGGERYYPEFYADSRYQLKHLAAVSKTLGDMPGSSKLQFFSTGKGSLGGKTPLQALADGQLQAVKEAAEGFVER